MLRTKYLFDVTTGIAEVVECQIPPVDEQTLTEEIPFPTTEERLAAMESALIALMEMI